jgi:hypothetical protein
MPESGNQSIKWGGKVGAAWCLAIHDSAMWPIHGEYECRTCGRHFPVPWAGQNCAPATAARRSMTTLRPAVLPLMVLLALLSAPVVRCSDSAMVEANSPEATAFARYIAGMEHVHPWGEETVEIEASLPKLKKAGSLRALRRLLPVGKPQYQVIEAAGDETVRQRVIVRYLSAEAQAAEIPAAAIAITPANYKFHYKGSTRKGGGLVYIFQITPLKNREGLIKGELWLDAETGAAVRQSGRFVKNPSILVKRIDITREITMHRSAVEARLTHLTVTARLVGTAELTILERPYERPVTASLPDPVE